MVEVTAERKEAFVRAVQAGDAEAARALLQGDPALREHVDAPWLDFDAPAIVHAAGKRAMVDVLLEFGADVNAESSWWAGGFTALHGVTGRMIGFNEEMARYLIERGAVVDAWSAAGLGMLDRLERLVAEDPDVVSRPGPDGTRPLHYSATPEVARLLLDHGANIDAQCIDHHGTAAQWGLGHKNMELSRYLLDAGARWDIFLVAALGDVTRASTALEANPELIRARMDKEAPGGYVYEYTRIGRQCAPLHAAASHDQAEMVRFLLDRGADPEARDAVHGGTPLGWARYFGCAASAAALEGRARQG